MRVSNLLQVMNTFFIANFIEVTTWRRLVSICLSSSCRLMAVCRILRRTSRSVRLVERRNIENSQVRISWKWVIGRGWHTSCHMRIPTTNKHRPHVKIWMVAWFVKHTDNKKKPSTLKGCRCPMYNIYTQFLQASRTLQIIIFFNLGVWNFI